MGLFSSQRCFSAGILLPLALCACAPAAPSSPSGSASSSASSQSSPALPDAGAAQSSASSIGAIAPLGVPFTSQAPLGVWDALHEEACEEAAMLMVIQYYRNEAITPQVAEQKIQDLVQWETQNGYQVDLTAAQMADIAHRKFGLQAHVTSDVTVDSIKRELAAGHPVILPTAGRDLGNPYFSGAGPWYHAIVVIGYQTGWFGDSFIVNDPGTKRGEHFTYKTDVLLNAVHDWTGVNERIREGKKVMVVIER